MIYDWRFMIGIWPLVLSLAVASTAKDIVLEWNANYEPDVTGYRVLMGTNNGGPYPQSWSVAGPTNTRLTVRNLAPGNYYFVAVAVNTSNVVSDFSNQVRASVPASPQLFIVEPPALRLTGVVYRATTVASPWSEMLRLPPVDVPLEKDTGFFQLGVEWGFIGHPQPAFFWNNRALNISQFRTRRLNLEHGLPKPSQALRANLPMEILCRVRSD